MKIKCKPIAFHEYVVRIDNEDDYNDLCLMFEKGAKINGSDNFFNIQPIKYNDIFLGFIAICKHAYLLFDKGVYVTLTKEGILMTFRETEFLTTFRLCVEEKN